MTKRVGARQSVLAALLPGAALLLAGVSEADGIFHVANYTYLHEEEIFFDSRLFSGDFNGDPYPDFVMGSNISSTEGSLEVFLGNGDGTLLALEHVITKEIRAMAVGDFDNDGLDDVLIKDYNYYSHSDTAMCYLSVGNGEFADPIAVPGFLWQVGGSSPNHMDVNDYDMDGNVDLALAAFDSIEVYLGAGDGTFSSSWGLRSTSGSFFSVESGDVTNDGITDLISLRSSFGVFPGLGDGTFGPETTGGSFPGPAWAGDACCGDFNEDGWTDVAVTAGEGIGSWTIFVFINHGDGTFSVNPDHSYLDGWGFYDIFCEDLDLDGHLDLGASIAQPDAAFFMHGVGDGSFDASQPLWSIIGFGGLSTTRGDYDQDGDPDVAVIRFDDPELWCPYRSGIYVVPNETIQNGIEGDDPAPVGLTLAPSSNPFTSSVSITCNGEVLPDQLMVYDITGRLVRTLSDRDGSSFTWDGTDGSRVETPSGTYLIQGAVDGWVSSIRVVRL